jgi:hypothetical protein
MKKREPSLRPHSRHLGMTALLALALGAQLGCGREFFREWANQDVSEAVFEKSRDPRFRIDMFSIDPPALSRYSDPYDPDVPPAPPDDRATEALGPAPQWPDNRLITPVEGTGYLDMLEAWKRQSPQPPQRTPAAAPMQPTILPPPAVPPPGSASPFQPPPNSGTNPSGMSPNTIPGPQPPNPPAPNPPEARAAKIDLGVRLAAFQETGLPMPVPAAAAAQPRPRPPAIDLPTPSVGMDPDPVNTDLSAPLSPKVLRPDLPPDQYRASEALGAEMAGILVPGEIDFNDAEAAGYPRDSKPYVITLEQAFQLALINSRFYQFQLEQLYIASLAVTLQRFAFQPQFFAGLSPVTGVLSGPSVLGGAGGGFPASNVNQTNAFLYRTRETGSPNSTLNLSTVAGAGKAFSSGAKLLTGFANQIAFNFLGKNSSMPTVQSSLPLTLVQPFLRGGGRAVTLEALTQAERTLVYQVRSFAQFRQQFLVTVLVGGQIQNFGSLLNSLGFSSGGNSDPVIGFINVIQDIQEIENDRKNIAAFEQLVKVYRELIEGESSGLSQLQLDQVDSSLQGARQQLVSDKLTYRNDLDQFKIQLGMPPDVPLVPDRSLMAAFKKTYNDIDEWQRNPNRDMADLPRLVAQLPELEDVVFDGRSVLSIYPHEDRKKSGEVIVNQEDNLEGLMLAAERVALERRLDLMNQRANLYDAWRQIRVTANALRGVLNVTLTNQFLTPPTTTNPFAFLEQAKQFSLVVNAELPLVRLAERNNFRQALINYQRQRRSLMNIEDFTKYQVRFDIRQMHTLYLNYEIAKRNLVLTIRQKDQAFEQIIAPPSGAAAGAQANQAAIQTTNLISFQGRLLTLEDQLAMSWQQYQIWRLSLYRDIGTMPYDEWEAFHELFPAASSSGGGIDAAQGGAARPARNPAPAPAEVGRQ